MTRQILTLVTKWLEFLQGADVEAPAAFRTRLGWLAIALWWVALICLITAFSGQSSKFIYIDF